MRMEQKKGLKETAVAVYYLSEINRRSVNEDSFCDIEFRINHEACVHAMILADGMGGLSGGKQYSREAVNRFNEKLLRLLMGEEFKDSPLEQQMDLLGDFCRQIFQEINQELYMNGLNAGMKGGTTLTAAIHFWDSWFIANCGDSPAYIMKDGRLKLVSEIQNAAWQMVRQGRTREGSTLFLQNKNRLLQYLGRHDPVTPYIATVHDKEADALLLGTDGAFGSLSLADIEAVLNGEKREQKILRRLFDRSVESGEEDNQTAILCLSAWNQKVNASAWDQKAYASAGAGKSPVNPAARGLKKTQGAGMQRQEQKEAIPGEFIELKEESISFADRLRSHLRRGGRRR